MAYQDTATDKEVVEFIDDLFSDPRRWIKNASAKDVNGHNVRYDSSEAACFCFSGALRRYSSGNQYGRLVKIVQRFLPNDYGSIPTFNDSAKTTVDDVRHVLRSVKLHLKHS